MPYGRVSRVGQEIRTKAFERILECVPAIRADPDAIRCGREDVVRGSGLAVDPAHGIGIRKPKTQAGGFPILPPVRGFHQAHPVGTAEIRIACGHEHMPGILRVKGHVRHPHSGPVRCAEQGPIVA